MWTYFIKHVNWFRAQTTGKLAQDAVVPSRQCHRESLLLLSQGFTHVSWIRTLNVSYLYRKGEVGFCLPEHATRILVPIPCWYNPGMRKGPEPGFHCIVWFRTQKRFPCIIWHSQRSLVGPVAKLGCHQLRFSPCPKGEKPGLPGRSALTSASDVFRLSSEDIDSFSMVTRNGVCSPEHEL